MVRHRLRWPAPCPNARSPPTLTNPLLRNRIRHETTWSFTWSIQRWAKNTSLRTDIRAGHLGDESFRKHKFQKSSPQKHNILRKYHMTKRSDEESSKICHRSQSSYTTILLGRHTAHFSQKKRLTCTTIVGREFYQQGQYIYIGCGKIICHICRFNKSLVKPEKCAFIFEMTQNPI